MGILKTKLILCIIIYMPPACTIASSLVIQFAIEAVPLPELQWLLAGRD